MKMKCVFVVSICLATLISGACVVAQQKQTGASGKNTVAAPVPKQILAAKKVFIANGGSTAAVFKGGPDRPYNQFYAAMKQWNHFELVDSPQNADVVLQISMTVTVNERNLVTGSYLNLGIIDPQTKTSMWNFTEMVRAKADAGTVTRAIILGIGSGKDWDKAFDQTMTRVVDDLKKLVALPNPDSKDSSGN